MKSTPIYAVSLLEISPPFFLLIIRSVSHLNDESDQEFTVHFISENSQDIYF